VDVQKKIGCFISAWALQLLALTALPPGSAPGDAMSSESLVFDESLDEIGCALLLPSLLDILQVSTVAVVVLFVRLLLLWWCLLCFYCDCGGVCCAATVVVVVFVVRLLWLWWCWLWRGIAGSL